jgi:SAM-dependent MidA family methyltransferase
LSLEERLRERIRRDGPISFYEWMKAALYDEREGYYCRADRIPQGRAGDYRTAPETSPLFAATFASYFAKLFVQLKSPTDWTIFEAGAGGGEFAFQVLNTLQADAPEVFAATNYVIDEASTPARDRARTHLAKFADRVSFRRFSETDNVDAGIVFSNELIDAFPVNRVVMRSGGLRQLYVGIDDSRFVWIESEAEKAVKQYCERIQLNLREGQIAEINLDAEIFVTRAAGFMKRGHVITVDYGAERRDLISREWPAGTLRAFHRHQFVNVLACPGERDVTTTIDWTQIKESGEGAGLQTVRFERLDQFLMNEGLLDRVAELARTMTNTAEALRLSTRARELVLPTGMAASFQVLVQAKKPDAGPS